MIWPRSPFSEGGGTAMVKPPLWLPIASIPLLHVAIGERADDPEEDEHGRDRDESAGPHLLAAP